MFLAYWLLFGEQLLVSDNLLLPLIALLRVAVETEQRRSLAVAHDGHPITRSATQTHFKLI